MKSPFKQGTAIAVFVFPALILYLAMVIIPIFVSGYFSTLEWNGVGKSIFVGLRNFTELFIGNTDGFVRSVINSFILAALSVFIQLPVAMLIALTLAWGAPGEKLFRRIYFFPVIISTVVICELWIQVYDLNYGLLNAFLRATGLGSFARAWLAEPEMALFSVFLPIVWQYMGYHMLLYYAGIQSIATELFEAARIDGASFWQTAMRITIPLLRPVIRITLVFAIVGSFKLFDNVYIMTGGGPLHATDVPSMVMYNTIFRKYRYGYGSSMAMFIIIESFLFSLLVQRGLRSQK